MDPIVAAAGSALVGAMASDAWTRVSSAIVRLWTKSRAVDDQSIGEELALLRERSLKARTTQDSALEAKLVQDWQERLEGLAAEDSELLGDLEHIWRELLLPESTARDNAGYIANMRATAEGSGRVYQAGRDMRIDDRG